MRGLMLVWIALAHLPTAASAWVNQPFGFVSAAEGFIFLSALFTGRIYSRMAEADGYRAMTFKLWGRTIRLYGYHAVLLAFAFLVAVPIAARGNRPGLHNLLDFYFTAGPKQAITEAALLIYRPPLLDILPMYIIFLALTTVVLPQARKIGWAPMLGASFTLWVLAQFGLRNAEHNFMMHYIPTNIPLNEMGPFDLWAWQFLWFVGVWLGVRWGDDDLPIETWAKRAVIPAIVVAVGCFVLRHAIDYGFEMNASAFLIDKWHLGFFRLLDFAAVALVLAHWQKAMKPITIRPFVLLGQSSLQVFCVHLLFCFAGLTLMGNASMLTSWQQIMLLSLTFTALLITAKLFSKSEAKNERQPKKRSAPAALPMENLELASETAKR